MTAPVDRAVEREKFEAQFPVPRDCIWCGNGYSATEYNAWDAHKHHDRWIGWFMRAELSAQTLASKEAELVRLRGALEKIADGDNYGEDGCWNAESYPDEIAEAALTQTPKD